MFKKENKQVKKIRRDRIISKVSNFFMSVGLGVIKATPFGHIVSEIENNLKHENGGIGKLDKVRFIFWIFFTGIFIGKIFDFITWDDIFVGLKLFSK